MDMGVGVVRRPMRRLASVQDVLVTPWVVRAVSVERPRWVRGR